MKNKPTIALLATGGTIAGIAKNKLITTSYTSGAASIDLIMAQVPQIHDLALIKAEQIANINSIDIGDELWIKLANKIQNLLTKVDGIVITHGTDTMEETAYFLDLTIKTNKPIVLTGAMRPLTSISYDGAKNLYNAVLIASKKNGAKNGVMISMNDKIFSAKGAVKTNSLNLDAFSSPNFPNLGYIIDDMVFFNKPVKSNLKFPMNFTKMPRVDILYTYSNDGSSVAARAFFENGSKGVVIAAGGAGEIHKDHKETLKELAKLGLKVVISSRTVCGGVVIGKEDEKFGFISAKNLNPQKARIMLMLALTKTSDTKTIQKYFLTQ